MNIIAQHTAQDSNRKAKLRLDDGVVIDIAQDNTPVAGCTISRPILDSDGYVLSWFSLAEGTDISAESYPTRKLLLVASGDLDVLIDGAVSTLASGGAIVTPIERLFGVRCKSSCDGAVYTEFTLKEDSNLDKLLKDGEAFKLAELVPFQKGRIINRDIVSDPKVKFVLMSFDEGTGLSEHSAPGEAIVFALEGKGIIGYEGEDHAINAGECFKFAKGGRHSVKADGPFKMALLLTLE